MSNISMPAWTSGIAASERRGVEDPTKPITWEQLSEILVGGESSELGKGITPSTAVQIGTVLACVRIIATAIARMPLIVYRKTERGRERATDHDAYPVLRMRPDVNCSAFSFFFALIANLLLWGNGYAEILRRPNGRLFGLVLIESHRVTPRMRGGRLVYEVTTSAGNVTLSPYNMLHCVGYTTNGVVGNSVISMSRRTLGIARSAGDAAGHIQDNGLRPGGVLETPGKMSGAAPDNLRKGFAELYGGPKNAGKVIVLEQGVTFKPWTMPSSDAELLASRQFSRKEIAEIFGVPLSLLGDNESAGSNVEAQALNFLNYTLDPIIMGLQQELNYKLFTAEEWDEVYCEFMTQVLLKMDSNARGNFYSKLFGVGGMNTDEIRARENLDSLPDERGQVHMVPSNMMPAPTPEQGDKLLEGWINKNGGGGPSPETDSKVAG